jgi:hypothetical protein
MLAPILNPVRELIQKGQLEKLYQARLLDTKTKPNADLITIHSEKFRHLMDSVNHFIHTQTDVTPIVREEYRGLDAILKLTVFEDHFPFPGSVKYGETLEFIQAELDAEAWTWYVLFLWNDLRLLGKAITSEPQFAEISRSWLDEWGVLRVVRPELESLGLDPGQVHRTQTVLKLLIQQQNWVTSIPEKTELALIEAWFSEEEIRTFLNINRYRGQLWFNKEAFEEMMWWMMTIALIQLISDPTKSLAEVVEMLFEAYERIKTILAAEGHSDYQVEKLLEGLK